MMVQVEVPAFEFANGEFPGGLLAPALDVFAANVRIRRPVYAKSGTSSGGSGWYTYWR